MNTLAARHSMASATARTASRRVDPRSSAAASAPVPGTGWIERLADWADRQPVHRRVGSWVLYR